MAAGIFGALGAIGDAGNQWADSRQMAHDEIVRRLAQKQAQQAADLNMQRTRQIIERGAFDLQTAKQPIAQGNPYPSNGKMYQWFLDPLTGAITNKEVPGKLPETAQEAMARGLAAIGDNPEEIKEEINAKTEGAKAGKQYTAPELDPSSPTGYSLVHRDINGKFLWKVPTMPPRQAQRRLTISDSTDPFGITTHRKTESGPVTLNPGAMTLPENAVWAPGTAPGGFTIQEDGTWVPNQPQGGQGAAGGYATPSAAPAAQGGAAAPRGASIVNQLASATMAVPNPKGLVEPGNILIWNRPAVQNADGKHSSEYSTSFADDQGREVLVPTIVNGRFLTPDGKKPPEGSDAEKAMFQEAWKHYERTGQHLGKFDNIEDADAYANVLHNRGSAPPAAAQPTPAATPKHRIVRKLANANVPQTSPPAAAAAAAPVPSDHGYNVGPFKGLDESGHIPMRPGLNPQLVAAANRLLDDSDVTKLGLRGADLQAVTALASKYGWRQGALTPQQQIGIYQVSSSIQDVKDNLGVMKGFWSRVRMASMPLDPTGEGGTKGVKEQTERSYLINSNQQEYLNAITRLRGMITNIRTFSGANNSNASADRLLAEIPSPTNTASEADARDKLAKLEKEIELIKKLGYFLPNGDPRLPKPSAAAAPPPGPAAAPPPGPAAAKPKTQAEIEADQILNKYQVLPARPQ